jgi:hypothetical protein
MHGIGVVELSVMPDHIHVIIDVPPTLSIFEAFRLLKGCSSHKLFERKPNFRKRYPRGHLWSPGKFYTSVGDADLQIVVSYIRTGTLPGHFGVLLRSHVVYDVEDVTYFGKRDFKSVLRASLVGIPLPLCSCGVLPTGIGLYRQGESKASTLAFIIATPATTITNILLILGMIGWKFMLIQIITVFGVALLTGLLAYIFLKAEEKTIELPREKAHRLHKGFMECGECKLIVNDINT